jgi:hypothetical protein
VLLGHAQVRFLEPLELNKELNGLPDTIKWSRTSAEGTDGLVYEVHLEDEMPSGNFTWRGFQQRTQRDQWVRMSCFIRFTGNVPEPSSNVGFKIQGSICNEWVHKVRPDEWTFVNAVSPSRPGYDHDHHLLIFDSMTGPQRVLFTCLKLEVFNRMPPPLPVKAMGQDNSTPTTSGQLDEPTSERREPSATVDAGERIVDWLACLQAEVPLEVEGPESPGWRVSQGARRLSMRLGRNARDEADGERGAAISVDNPAPPTLIVLPSEASSDRGRERVTVISAIVDQPSASTRHELFGLSAVQVCMDSSGLARTQIR